MNNFFFSSFDDVSKKVQETYLGDFLKTEIVTEDARRAILEFISNWNIRAGEYEGNTFIVYKLDRKNIIVYADEQWGDWGEDETRNRLISRCIPICTKDLINLVKAYCIPN